MSLRSDQLRLKVKHASQTVQHTSLVEQQRARLARLATRIFVHGINSLISRCIRVQNTTTYIHLLCKYHEHAISNRLVTFRRSSICKFHYLDSLTPAFIECVYCSLARDGDATRY